MHSVTVLEASCPKSRCQQSCAPSADCREQSRLLLSSICCRGFQSYLAYCPFSEKKIQHPSGNLPSLNKQIENTAPICTQGYTISLIPASLRSSLTHFRNDHCFRLLQSIFISSWPSFYVLSSFPDKDTCFWIECPSKQCWSHFEDE